MDDSKWMNTFIPTFLHQRRMIQLRPFFRIQVYEVAPWSSCLQAHKFQFLQGRLRSSLPNLGQPIRSPDTVVLAVAIDCMQELVQKDSARVT